MARGEEPSVHVELVHCAGRGQWTLQRLSLPEGSTVRDALRVAGPRPAAGPSAATPGPSSDAVDGPPAPDVGIFGRRVALGRVLAEGDRVELYRPLRMAPNEARQERHRAQRQARAAALRARRQAPAP